MRARYVLRWWGHYPRCGPFFWYYGGIRAARASARRMRGEYELVDMRTNSAIEWQVIS